MARPEESPKTWRQRITPHLTTLAHVSAPFISTFILVHLSAPALANFGGTSLASRVMLLGREYYQTSFGEKYLLLTPLAIHTISALSKRFISPSSICHRPRLITNVLTVTGYATFAFFLPVHFLIHRVYPADPSDPIIDALGPSELDYEFVKFSLQRWPWRSWFLYAGLTTCVVWHAAEGMRIIWGTYLAKKGKSGAGAVGVGKRDTTKSRMLKASALVVLPVLTGVFAMAREPLYAFSSLTARFEQVLARSFVFRI